MPAPKGDAEKALQGTLRRCRVKPPRATEAIEQDMQLVTKATEAMEFNLRLASDSITKDGVMITTVVTDSHGKTTQVERLHPAFKVQRDSLRMLLTLRKQAVLLEAELTSAGNDGNAESEHADEWNDSL